MFVKKFIINNEEQEIPLKNHKIVLREEYEQVENKRDNTLYLCTGIHNKIPPLLNFNCYYFLTGNPDRSTLRLFGDQTFSYIDVIKGEAYGIFEGTEFARLLLEVIEDLSSGQVEILFNIQNGGADDYYGGYIVRGSEYFQALYDNPTQENANELLNWLDSQNSTILYYQNNQ